MITLEQKEEVIKMRNEGCSFKLIANTLNVERLQVRDFCRTKTAKGMGLQDNIQTVHQVSYNPPKEYCCENCGGVYTKRDSDINSVNFCSRICKEEDRTKRIEAKKKECLKCNTLFLPKSNLQRYCSVDCRTIILQCEVCGKDFNRLDKKQYRKQKTCSARCSSTMTTKTHEDFYKEFSSIHKGMLVPVEVYTRADDEITCYCLVCKRYTRRVADKYINQRKHGCKHCGRKYSNGESTIKEYLKKNNVNYEKQYALNGLVSNKGFELRFDFAIFDSDRQLKFLIEYDGRQHYEPVDQFGGIEYFKEVQCNDRKKDDYCKANNINLIRINYKQNILKRLEEMEW